MVDLLSAFRLLQAKRVAVIGDFVLDTYVLGSVSRLSPEAPVPVLHVKEIKHIPGMAGNVALNLISLGAKVSAIGRIGNDPDGARFINYLQAQEIDTDGIAFEKNYPTPVKQRMIASSQQLLRVDNELVCPLSLELENNILSKLQDQLGCVDCIAVSDYKKGFLTQRILQKIFEIGRKNNIPVIVDPKGEDFTKYQGSTLIKPNLSEAYAAAKKSKETPLDEVAKLLLEQTKSDFLLITKSEEGMTLYTQEGEKKDFPVKCHEVKDVTGAGDTVLAMMTLALACKMSLEQGAELSNLAASVVIQRLGCSRVTLSEIAQALLIKDHRQKVFKEHDLFALHQILDKQSFYLFGLSKDQTFTLELFNAFRELSSKNRLQKLLIYVESHPNNEEFISLLSSLQEVDYILVHPGNLVSIIKDFKPLKAFQMKENQLLEVCDAKLLLQELLTQKVT